MSEFVRLILFGEFRAMFENNVYPGASLSSVRRRGSAVRGVPGPVALAVLSPYQCRVCLHFVFARL